MKKNFKILHVGNIANNAYLNSKFLRETGIKSDVLCYDYYHIMGCPEWEDAEIKGDWGNDFDPDWSKVDLGNFKRPEWFFQGPLEELAQEKFKVQFDINSIYKVYNKPLPVSFFDRTAQSVSKFQSFLYRIYLRKFHQPQKTKLKMLSFLGKFIAFEAGLLIRYLNWAARQLVPLKIRVAQELKDYQYFRQLIDEFKFVFPQRKDKLTIRDIKPFLYRTEIFKAIFKKYDFIQCYATDPIYAMFADKHPYIAFEHGTIREIPFENSAIGRLTALAYRKADLVFITNADNLEAVKKLGLKNYLALPHPLDNFWHLKFRNVSKDKNQKILFCPVRHDWKIKGIDLYIHALPKIVKKTHSKIKLIFLEWGMDVEKSKNLIRKLHLEKNILWLKPLPRHQFIYWFHKSAIVLDQLILPSMGGITAEAMQAGKPVLTSYKHETNKWMFPEKPPILEVHTKKEIVDSILKLLNNPELAQKIGKSGQKWFAKYHSKQKVKEILISNYLKLLKKYRI